VSGEAEGGLKDRVQLRPFPQLKEKVARSARTASLSLILDPLWQGLPVLTCVVFFIVFHQMTVKSIQQQQPKSRENSIQKKGQQFLPSE